MEEEICNTFCMQKLPYIYIYLKFKRINFKISKKKRKKQKHGDSHLTLVLVINFRKLSTYCLKIHFITVPALLEKWALLILN